MCDAYNHVYVGRWKLIKCCLFEATMYVVSQGYCAVVN